MDDRANAREASKTHELPEGAAGAERRLARDGFRRSRASGQTESPRGPARPGPLRRVRSRPYCVTLTDTSSTTKLVCLAKSSMPRNPIVTVCPLNGVRSKERSTYAGDLSRFE
jgi:hypothetical protein